MKHNIILYFALIFLIMSFTLACGISFSGDNDNETEQLKLQLTLQALQMTQAASGGNQNMTVQDAQPAAVQSSSNQQPAAMQQASPTPTDDGIPCNSSNFVSETIPDFTIYQPGVTFQKSWTLRNAGDCDWNENYVFEYEEGSRMGGESSIKVNTVIEPGETVTFTVNLKAPVAAGDYVGVWRLKAADGEKLGKYWVKIKVGPPPEPFSVKSVNFSTPAQPIHINCPGKVTVTANVKATAAGTVTYKWTDCEGGSSTGSIVFDSAGTKSVTHKVSIDWTDAGHWAGFYVDNPNHQDFGYTSLNVICD